MFWREDAYVGPGDPDFYSALAGRPDPFSEITCRLLDIVQIINMWCVYICGYHFPTWVYLQ